MKRIASLIGALALLAVNYHNGFVEIRNDTAFPVDVRYRNGIMDVCSLITKEVPNVNLVTELTRKTACIGAKDYTLTVPPGRSIHDNDCCTVAGQTYTYRFGPNHIAVTAQLCNREGIPFGFARIRITPHGIFADNGPCPS